MCVRRFETSTKCLLHAILPLCTKNIKTDEDALTKLDGQIESTVDFQSKEDFKEGNQESQGTVEPKRKKKVKKEKRPKILEPELTLFEVKESDLREQFVKGNGPGGQKINKTNSMIVLKHIPTGLIVKCQYSRSQSKNREEARHLLQRKIAEHAIGYDPKARKKIEKLQKRKADKKRKQKKKARTANENPDIE
eukprot:CFRG0306T1